MVKSHPFFRLGQLESAGFRALQADGAPAGPGGTAGGARRAAGRSGGGMGTEDESMGRGR